ncbi:MAG: monovalent cation/H(+) antiporter subunit G, partial [Ectothiorhodospiraceae bacterium]
DVISWVFLVAGGLLVLTGGVGVLRLPDVYTRLHAAGVTDTLAAMLILTGLMFQAGLTQATIKLALILGFLLFTSPVSSHALAKAAITGGVEPKQQDQG